jgi:hypothetical protein
MPLAGCDGFANHSGATPQLIGNQQITTCLPTTTLMQNIQAQRRKPLCEPNIRKSVKL